MCAHLPTIPQQSDVGLWAAIDATLPQPSPARKYVPEKWGCSCDEILMTRRVNISPLLQPWCRPARKHPYYGMAALNAPTKPRS